MLRSVRPFSLLTDAEYSGLTQCAGRRSYSTDATIVRPNEKLAGIHFVVSGQVVALMDDEAARSYIVGTFGPNDFFGETYLFSDAPSRIRFRAQGPTQVLCLPRKRLLELVQQNGPFASFLFESVLTRLDEAHRKLEGFAFMTVYERVAQLLMETAEQVRGNCLVRSGTETIAGMVGASREMVSRVLRQMIDSGALRRDKRNYVVTEPSLIAEAAATRNARIVR